MQDIFLDETGFAACSVPYGDEVLRMNMTLRSMFWILLDEGVSLGKQWSEYLVGTQIGNCSNKLKKI